MESKKNESKNNFIFFNFNIFKIFFVLIYFVISIFFLNFSFNLILNQIFFVILFFLFNLKFLKSEKRELEILIEKNLLNGSNINTKMFLRFPLPLVILQMSGEIIWFNDNFQKIFEKQNLFKTSIKKIIPSYDFSKILKNFESGVLFDESIILLGEKKYQMFYEIFEIKKSDKNIKNIILYFIDKTKECQLLEKNSKESVVQCLIVIDNFDEILQNTPSENHGKLIGAIEQEIVSWANEFSGVFKKCEKNKFFILFENWHFEKIIKDKFEILNKIRNISEGNKISATLSIGVGKDENVFKNNKLCQSALDMALGRGGDQAVVKNKKNFCFYGAKTREIEKRTKVKIRVFTHAFRETIEQFDKIIIMGHKGLDIDCFGASVGLFKISYIKNKNTYILIGQNTNNIQLALKEIEDDNDYKGRIINEQEAIKIFNENSLLIIVDTNRTSLVESERILNMSKQTVLIDHHRRSEDFIESTILTYHEPFASSTSEIVTEMFEYIPSKNILEPKEAEIIYSGIVMDTKNFTFKTGKRTFEAAAYLKSVGVDSLRVKKMFQSSKSLFLKKAQVIKTLEVYNENIAICYGDSDNNKAQILSAMVADSLLEIENIKASFALISSNNLVTISARSFENMNVQLILEKFGGGGHMTVAGAQVQGANVEYLIEKLKLAIDESLKK